MTAGASTIQEDGIRAGSVSDGPALRTVAYASGSWVLHPKFKG